MIADNALAERSSWDEQCLKLQIDSLIEIGFDLELTGLSTTAIDLICAPSSESVPTPEDKFDDLLGHSAVSKSGDLWTLDQHKIICGDCRLPYTFDQLMGDERAKMVVTDPPYNVKIEGHARGRSRKKHREFAMASGEMTPLEFVGFLETAIHRATHFSSDGSIHYWFMDWRHLPDLLKAALPQYSQWKNLLVWRKSNAGQGSFYRSQHELIAVFKAGTASHINNFGLGAGGRYRTNVLDYPGGATPDDKRQQELAIHPTVKPVALIADLMRDCSHRRGLILDLFGGSGTALLAAEVTGRRARVVEIDPLYVDLAVRRWQKLSGKKAYHQNGSSFDDLSQEALANV